jgi:hypothetical protein
MALSFNIEQPKEISIRRVCDVRSQISMAFIWFKTPITNFNSKELFMLLKNKIALVYGAPVQWAAL